MPSPMGFSGLTDGSVTAVKLATDAVETAKIKALAVTAAKLAADAVETAKIKALAVTAAKIAAGAVTAAKLAAGQAAEAHFSASYTDVTAQRSIDTTYTNTNDTALFVFFTPTSGGSVSRVDVLIDDVVIGSGEQANGSLERAPISFIVPPGSTYRLTEMSGIVQVDHWAELIL